MVFEQCAMGDPIYVLAAGELDIVRQLPGGDEESLKVVKAGDYFGEIGPLFNLPRSATVRARTHATVIGYIVTDVDTPGAPARARPGYSVVSSRDPEPSRQVRKRPPR